MDAKKAQKIAKIKIQKMKFNARRAFVTLFATTSTLAVGTPAANAPGGIKDINRNDAPTHTNYERKVKIDIDKEVEKRADWIINEYLEASSNLLTQLKSIRDSNKKAKFIKENIFNQVSPRAGIPGTGDYCIAAINRSFRGVDSTALKELENFLPPTDIKNRASEAAVRCIGFKEYLAQNGYNNFISSVSYNQIDFDKLNPGDIIMEPREEWKKHATTYIGDGRVRSFNVDSERRLSRKSGQYYIFDTKGIVKQAIYTELEKQNLVQKNDKGYQNTMALENASKLVQYLYQGRDGGDLALLEYTSHSPGTYFASNQMFKKVKSY